jgi:PhoD-like phosphatase, N-terminal domain
MLPGRELFAASSFGDNPFTLGVASGDPTPDGIVLWTRLAPDPVAPQLALRHECGEPLGTGYAEPSCVVQDGIPGAEPI